MMGDKILSLKDSSEGSFSLSSPTSLSWYNFLELANIYLP